MYLIRPSGASKGTERDELVSELVKTSINWCLVGKGEAKGKARQKELGRRDGTPAKTYAATLMATRHRDVDKREQTALLGAEVLATSACRRWVEILHPRV